MIRAALGAVDAGRLVERALGKSAAFPPDRPLTLIAAGKAASAMAAAAVAFEGVRVADGVVIAPGDAGDQKSPTAATVGERLRMICGGHPIPTSGSEQGGRHAIALAESTPPAGHLLVLLSGGASSLMAVPAAGVSLDDKQRTTDRLLRAGANIHELNTVRKHLSAVKGGWLAAASKAPSWTLAISDVVGDDPSVIGSGPTVADRSTYHDALDVVQRFGGPGVFPAAVVARLASGARGDAQETPKPGDGRLAAAEVSVIGTRFDAMRGAADAARALGYAPLLIEAPVLGEARDAAAEHLRAIERRAAGASRPLSIISSGETTVRVAGPGRGGRNQEFALAAAELMPPLGRCAAASVGTDGIDGPTDAAGAIVDSSTIERAAAARLPHPSTFLRDNNAYRFFEPLGDLIQTGPTGTNVGDLQIFLLA
jgi:hydroxypyruvate reductase